MKNFVPRDEPQVPLLMSAIEQQQLSVENGPPPPPSCGDDDLDAICTDLLADDQPQLSPLTNIDKSAPVVGMSYDIDDVVDSVINRDDLPPLADLSQLAVLPPPSLSPAAAPTTLHAAESMTMPKLSSNLKVPGLTHVNSEPAILVRLRRLNFHRYCSPDVWQRADPSVSSNCVQSLNVTSVAETARNSSSTVDKICNTSCKFVEQERDQSTSKRTANELHKSVSVKRGSGSSEKAVKSPVKKCIAGGTGRQSPVVVLTGLSADVVRSASRVSCSQVEVTTQRRSSTCQSSSVKHKLADGPNVCAVKKQRTDTVPTPPDSKLWCV